MKGIMRQGLHVLLLMDANAAFAAWILKRCSVNLAGVLSTFTI